MHRPSLFIAICIVLLSVFTPLGADCAQLQLFGVNKVDGVLSLDYKQQTESYPSSTKETSSLSQNYRLQVGSFVLHPKFLTWDLNGDFGISRSGDETSFNNSSYGTSIRLLRDFFLSAGAAYSIGQDTVSVPYAPSYTRDREEQSADFSLRFRHFPTNFSYKTINLNSDAQSHEEDSTENRLGINTNFWFGQGLRGSIRLNGTQKTDRLAETEPEMKYYNASLSHSWNSKSRNLSWSSGLQLYRKDLPDTVETLSLSESVNYRNGTNLTSGASFSASQNSRESYEEQKLGGSWNLSYQFTPELSSRIETGLNRSEYQRSDSPIYLQDRYDVKGYAEYRVRNDGFSYYATANMGYMQRDVEGEGQITITERVTLDEFGMVTLKYPTSVDDINDVVRKVEDNSEYSWLEYKTDSEGYVTIIVQQNEPDEELDGQEFWVTYSYYPQHDDKEMSGGLRIGADKQVAQNISVNAYASANLRQSLLKEDVSPTKSHELYVGGKIDHKLLTFTGGLRSTDRQNSLNAEARYDHGGLNLTGRYANEFTDVSDSRHTLSLTGRYYTYIPIGIRLTLQATEKRVYRSGEMIDGDFSFTSSAKYPLRRYMWLKDDFKFSLDHTYDNSLRWSNLLGFEWKQGLFSLESGYELVGNKLTGYESSKITVKLSRRF